MKAVTAGRNPNLDYLDYFGEDGRKILWDAEATGIAPILMTECFAGVGAPYIASAGLPIKTVAISEHSGLAPAQCAVWATRAPEVTNLDDITAPDFVPRMMEILEEERHKNPGFGQVTVIFGGSPCQAYSFAGKRQGLRDDRGNLALRYANVAIEGGYDIVGWENVVGALSDKTNGFGHLVGLLSGLSRVKVDWSPLICDDRFLKAVETSEELASREEGVMDISGFMDSNPHAAEALLSDEGFKAVVCADTVKADTLAGDLKAKVKAGGVSSPKAAKAVLSGDRQAFLDAMAESSDPIDECLIHLAQFCTAPHELVSPESWWTKVGGKKNQRWPSAGVVVGPERVLAWRVMDAQEYGVPQRRKRVFLFATKVGIDPTKFLFDWPSPTASQGWPASQASDQWPSPTASDGWPAKQTSGAVAVSGISRKPDLVLDGEKGKVLVFVPDAKTKKFGTSIDSKNGGNFVEPHWGEGPLVGFRKAKLSDPGFLIRGTTPDDKNLGGIAAFGVEFRAEGRAKPVPVRLLQGLDEAVAFDVDELAERLRLRSVEAALRAEGVAEAEKAITALASASPEGFAAGMLELAARFEAHVAFQPVNQNPGVTAEEADLYLEADPEDTVETIAAE